MKNPSIMVLLPLLMTLIFHVQSGNSSLAPAFYIFGDSLLDNGNNNPLPTQAKVNFLPYGMNFRGGVPTGRFTNGRTSGDFIAEFLGLSSPPPYSSLSAIDKLRVTPPGTNFASGSCGILPDTGNLLGKCYSLDDQINFFETMVKGEQAMQPHELSKYLSNSIFLFNIGANDYLNNYLNPQYPSGKLYTPQSYAQHLNEQLSLKLQRMYNLGARKIVVFEIGSIGCTPAIRLQTQHESLCNEDINKLPQLFNENLALMLQNLTSTLVGSAFTVGEISSLGYDAIFNPSHYGLTDSTNSCCTKISNNTGTCMPGIENACQNPNDHYFFDGFHPAERLYKAIALSCFQRTSVCKPNNIRGLAQLKI